MFIFESDIDTEKERERERESDREPEWGRSSERETHILKQAPGS